MSLTIPTEESSASGVAAAAPAVAPPPPVNAVPPADIAPLDATTPAAPPPPPAVVAVVAVAPATAPHPDVSNNAPAAGESLPTAKISTIGMATLTMPADGIQTPMTPTLAASNVATLTAQIEATNEAVLAKNNKIGSDAAPPKLSADNPTTKYRKRTATKTVFKQPLQPTYAAAKGLTTLPTPVADGKDPASKRKRATEKEPPSKRKSPTKKKAVSPSVPSPKKNKGEIVFEGFPTESFPGSGDWPEGWVKRVYKRQSGVSKGHMDGYWYSPQIGVKLRSMVEIKRFVMALDLVNGDEAEAKKIFKSMPI